MAELIVEIVALDRKIWAGAARLVRVRTTEGDIGIMPGHESMAGLLKPGEFAIDRVDGDRLGGRIDSGLVSVDDNRVTVVADKVTLDAEQRSA
ncbi:F-type H+-transporting ATPase subunit epsilon [Kocuria rhizophila]|uniref:ATP synthase epsilon chain n=2 Tax=Kocuria rhizophila TaxID=72000 RepID=B2GLZ1_KOCRD|nr:MULTISPECIES: F0F1 ATP synthase subunit epsilon [Kocuria]HBH56057.1 F0F1 ATP synthase subunit epsilon [Kocuria sp.]ASE10750.1 F0F1 ATP synthase subunit epsilon [Kocuria rhizophila]MBK4119618.1 F0F1 ATP synthase subunit epsilon [Kocuria rhizophila]MBO4145212.1 F0F1 ATP synthase subunit epsilon [Kocuria rhizophila]MCC5672984.1 F0F1 ATP synthase subunit epsilon [Kocuria rhizophila]